MGAAELFAGVDVDANFTRYAVELQVRDKLIGGIPKDPDTIAKWIQARLDMDDRALLELVQATAHQMQTDRSVELTSLEAEYALLDKDQRKTPDGEALAGRIDQLKAAERPTGDELISAVAREFEGGNGFKTIDDQLVYEGRCAKAALKESCNIAYPGANWPSKSKVAQGFRKGLMSTFAERVFVPQLHIPLGVNAPTGTEQRIKHVMTPQGPRSAINVVDYVERPTLSFEIQVLDDFLSWAEWGRIWKIAEEIGIGADRARSDGKFDLVTFKQV